MAEWEKERLLHSERFGKKIKITIAYNLSEIGWPSSLEIGTPLEIGDHEFQLITISY